MRILRLAAPFVALAGAVAACNRDAPPAPVGEPPAPSASGTAAASAPPAVPADLCTVESENSWGKGANGRTGITVTRGDEGRVALGVAFGNRPQVLVFDKDGKGTLMKVSLKEGGELTKSIGQKEGRRDMQRVTPYWDAGEMKALVDYRDKYESGRRRIACGPSTSDAPALLFDGKSKFVGDEERKAQKIAAAKKPDEKTTTGRPVPAGSAGGAGKVSRLLPPGAKRAPPGAAATPVGSAPPVVAAKPAEKAPPPPGDKPETKPTGNEEKIEPIHELRDCRSFVDSSSGVAWGVGSELVGKIGDTDIAWTLRMFVQRQGSRTTLYTSELEKVPKAAFTLEAPVAARLGDGWTLTGRYKDALVGWVLDGGMRARGLMRRYGAHPGLVRAAEDKDGGLLLLVAQTKAEDKFVPKAMQVAVADKSLPASLADLAVQGPDPSVAEPSFARAGTQGWIAVHSGPRRKARLLVFPLADDLSTSGKFFELTKAGDSVYESNVFALPDGRLLVVYILNGTAGNAELQSKVLKCKA